ncbi:MAG: hypothetical protein HZC40_16600 [Chloroflexi bacterium]|nr:hypothetical protein [Chloroflexota bacterium]
MSAVTYELKASYAFIERNINIVKRYWAWEFVWLIYSITNSLSVAFIGPGVGAIGATNVDSRYLVLYLIIGTIVWRYLSVIFYWLADVIGMERWEGTIEYTLMAPITRMTHLVGHTAFAVVYSLAHTALRFFATYSPATYVLEGTRAALLDGVPTLALGQYIAPLLVMGAILVPLGLWSFRAAETYAKKTGKLKRNG